MPKDSLILFYSWEGVEGISTSREKGGGKRNAITNFIPGIGKEVKIRDCTLDRYNLPIQTPFWNGEKKSALASCGKELCLISLE